MVSTMVRGGLNGIPGVYVGGCIVFVYYLVWFGLVWFGLFSGLYFHVFKWERPNHNESTASRLLSEVKHYRAWLVLRWGTTLESRVLFSLFFFCFTKSDSTHQFFTHNFTGMPIGSFLDLSMALERAPQELSFPIVLAV